MTTEDEKNGVLPMATRVGIKISRTAAIRACQRDSEAIRELSVKMYQATGKYPTKVRVAGHEIDLSEVLG